MLESQNCFTGWSLGRSTWEQQRLSIVRVELIEEAQTIPIFEATQTAAYC